MGTIISIFKDNIQKRGGALQIWLLIGCIILSSSCTLTTQKRLEVLNRLQEKEINAKILPLAKSDSVQVFNEVTSKRNGDVLAEILYLRIYQSKLLPADNNLAEVLAKNICRVIWPVVPDGRKYTLWKLQFVKEKGGNRVQLQKIFNFLPSEIVKNDSIAISLPRA